MDPAIVLFGLGVGLLVGATGMGGGSLMTPLLILVIGVQPVEWDEKRSMWKYNPLVEWTEKDLWRRIHERDLPYHPLHDQGYASIGCAPCTLPGDGRSGRWAGTDKTECGLHV